MSTEFFNDQWRIPSNENQNKISNYSMEFDGSSDYIDAGTGLGDSLGTYTGDASISLWFKADTTTGNDGLFTMAPFNGSDFGNLRINIYNNDLYFVSEINNYKYTSFTDTTSWHHLVCIFKSGDITNSKIYLDGVDKTTTDVGTFPSSLSLTGLKTIIGAYRGTSNTFNGKIDQVTFFDYALSQDQVTQLGAEGYAFNFNGSTQAIDCGANSRFNIDQITISGWVKLEDNLTNMHIIGGIRNTSNGIITYLINHHTNGKFRFVINQSSDNAYKLVYANDNTVLNTWYHVVGVADGSNVKLYINGDLQTDQTTYDGTITSPTQNFNIGRQPSNPLYYLDGELSNIAVFNTGLSQSQVNTLYNSGKPLPDMSSFTSLQGWWKLDDTATFNSSTSVWTITDDSSNSNNGSSVGMNASNLVASNINGELIANPMATSPKPIYYAQLGDQSVDNGANYLVPNNSLSDYVFDFDGGNDYIDITETNFLNASGQASFSFWVKPKTYSVGYGYFISGNTSSKGGLAYSEGGSSGAYYPGVLYWYNGSSSIILDVVVTENVWNHITIVFDGTSIRTFKNGSLGTTKTVTAPSQLSFDTIGRYTPNSGNYLNGQLSNFSIFDTALTAPQVTTIYNNGSPSTDISSLSPTAWYKLNASDTFDGNDWTINDYGSGGNDGTSSGMDSSNLVISDLQKTNGFSPYALSFAADDYLDANRTVASNLDFSVSAWINPTSHDTVMLGTRNLSSASTSNGFTMNINSSGNLWGRIFTETSNIIQVQTGSTISLNNWSHVGMTYNSSSKTLKTYLNGSEVGSIIGTDSSVTSTAELNIGRASIGTFYDYFDGSISNVSIFNTELSSTQVTEIYNQGVPSNLNTFSGTAPVAWWQLGSNSSFNTNWTCLDEIGTNNAVSVNMTNDDITNGVGYSANGLGTSTIDIVGDAPYSTANGLSEDMDVLDRVKDVPS